MTLAVVTWVTTVALVGIMLWWCLRRGHVAAIAILAILVPHALIRPLLFFFGLDDPYPRELFRDDWWELVARALLATMSWIVVFFGAYAIFVRPVSPLRFLAPHASGTSSPRILVVAALLTTALGAALSGLLVLRAGSVGSLMYQVKIDKALAGYYIIRDISVLGAIISAVALLYYVNRLRLPKARRLWGILAVISLALFIVNLMFNYFWGNRYNIAMLLVALVVGWHFYIRKLTVLRLMVVVLLLAVVLQTLKVIRAEGIESVWSAESTNPQPFWVDVSTSLHLSQFDAFMLALRDAGEQFPFRDGRDFKNGLLAWVPRALYPEKETFHVGSWFRRVYQPEKINGWPVTTMGDWYVNFGYWGIFFGAVVSGVFAAVFDAGFRNIRESPWEAMVAPASAFLLFDGGVDPGFLQAFFLVMVPIYSFAILLNIAERAQLNRSRRIARSRVV